MRHLWLLGGIVCAAVSAGAGLSIWFLYWKLMVLWIENTVAAVLATILSFVPFGALVVPFVVEDGTVPDYSSDKWLLNLVVCTGTACAAGWCLRRWRSPGVVDT